MFLAWYIYYGQLNQYGVLNITITVAGVTGSILLFYLF